MGCLKDKDYDNGLIQSVHTNGTPQQVVEIKLTATSTSNFFVLAVNNSNNDTTVDLVPINLATANPAPQDIHVAVSLDSNLVVTYDTTGTAAGTPGGDYAIPSSSMYSIVNPVVTIPQGSHTSYLQIKFKPSAFIGADWALGFKITAIQEAGYVISGNLSTGIVAIGVKNQYDGNYNTSGVRTRFNGATEGSGVLDMFTISGVVGLSTVNANTIAGQLADAGSGGTMALTVNADNTVTISNPAGGAYPTLVNTTGKISTYDPTSQTFHIYASYLNSVGSLREVDETLVKVP